MLCPHAVVPALAQAHAHPVLDQSLCCTPSSGTILPTLETGKCSPRAHLHPRATQDRSSCFGRFPCPPLPPRHLISSLVMFQSPGETGRSPESQPQKWQTAAPPWPRLLPSATLQRRAAFSLSLRLPPAERLAFRRRMEKRRGSHLLSSLGADAQSQSQDVSRPRRHRRLGQGPGHTEATVGPRFTSYWVPVLPRCPHPATATSAVAEFPIAQ